MGNRSLFIDERPILVMPRLATRIGLNDAIILQQIHYWLTNYEDKDDRLHFRDGSWWVWNTAEEWQVNFPWLSVTTVRRTLASLRERGYVACNDTYNKNAYDRTLWYTIDYDKVYDEAGNEKNPSCQNDETPSCQNDNIEISKMTVTIPETTHKTTINNNTRATRAKIEADPLDRFPAGTPARRKEDAAESAIVAHFTTISGLRIRGSEKYARWYNPARELLQMVDWDIDKATHLVTAAHKKMKADKLTFDSIQSIMRVAVFLMAQDVAPARTGIKEW
jgi:hypothetical protein